MGKPTNVVAFLNQQMHSQLEQEAKRWMIVHTLLEKLLKQVSMVEFEKNKVVCF
jgi:hypothetical protein